MLILNAASGLPGKHPRIVVNWMTGEVRRVKIQKPEPKKSFIKRIIANARDIFTWEKEPESWTKITDNTHNKTWKNESEFEQREKEDAYKKRIGLE